MPVSCSIFFLIPWLSGGLRRIHCMVFSSSCFQNSPVLIPPLKL